MDYKEIIENLRDDSVIELMKKLGCDRYINNETHIIFPTICHNVNAAEASMKLYYYKDTKLFVCYTECGNLSIFNLLKHYYQSRHIEYDWYKDIYKVILNCSNFKIPEFQIDAYESIKSKYEYNKKVKELSEYNPGVLDCFIKKYPVEWLNEGISCEAMDKYNILYSISQNKIIIPHYDVTGRLVGIRGRALDQWEIDNVGKYLPVKVEQTFYKHPLSMNLYGLNLNKDNIRRNGYCFVLEGEKSVMKLESFSRDNCGVAVCGSSFNKYQLNILLEHCQPKEIIICFDKEEKKGEDKYFYKLYNLCKKYSNYCNFSFIYDMKNLLNLKDSPTDKGEEIFEQLLKERVIVK